MPKRRAKPQRTDDPRVLMVGWVPGAHEGRRLVRCQVPLSVLEQYGVQVDEPDLPAMVEDKTMQVLGEPWR